MILNLKKQIVKDGDNYHIDLAPQERERLLCVYEALESNRLSLKEAAAEIAEIAAQNGLGGDDGDDPYIPWVSIESDELRPLLLKELRARGIEAV